MTQKYSVILFDLDGTLIDSMGGFAVVAADVIHRYYGIELNEAREMYRRTSGLPFKFQLESLFPNDSHNTAAEAEYETEKIKSYLELPFFEDTAPALQTLREMGFKLVLSSNNHEEVVQSKMAPVVDLFDDILSYRPGFTKGAPHFSAVEKKFSVGPAQCLFVGDSLHDFRLAKQYGMGFAARLGTFEPHEFDTIATDYLPLYTLFDLVEGLKKGQA